jgi:hypothetical protein
MRATRTGEGVATTLPMISLDWRCAEKGREGCSQFRQNLPLRGGQVHPPGKNYSPTAGSLPFWNLRAACTVHPCGCNWLFLGGYSKIDRSEQEAAHRA